MSAWIWFATIWFGTIVLLFVMSWVTVAVRSRWGLSDHVLMQIRKAVADGILEYDLAEIESEGGGRGRGDTLPFKFNDLDDLSEQL